MHFVESRAVRYGDPGVTEILPLKTGRDQKIYNFYENLRKSPGVKLNELKVSKGLHNLFVAVWNC